MEWAGKEARKIKSTLSDLHKFVTFALDSVILSTVHWKNKGDAKGKKD